MPRSANTILKISCNQPRMSSGQVPCNDAPRRCSRDDPPGHRSRPPAQLSVKVFRCPVPTSTQPVELFAFPAAPAGTLSARAPWTFLRKLTATRFTPMEFAPRLLYFPFCMSFTSSTAMQHQLNAFIGSRLGTFINQVVSARPIISCVEL